MTAYVQAVIFKKDKWTTPKARRWLKKNNYTPIKKVHITDDFYRYRINEPDKYTKFTTKKLKDGIELILGFNS